MLYIIPIIYLQAALYYHSLAKKPMDMYRGIRTVVSMRTQKHWRHIHNDMARRLITLAIFAFLLALLASFLDLVQKYRIPIVIIQLIGLAFIRLANSKEAEDFDRKFKETLKESNNLQALYRLYPDERKF